MKVVNCISRISLLELDCLLEKLALFLLVILFSDVFIFLIRSGSLKGETSVFFVEKQF